MDDCFSVAVMEMGGAHIEKKDMDEKSVSQSWTYA
jgi:hypothetical protein